MAFDAEPVQLKELDADAQRQAELKRILIEARDIIAKRWCRGSFYSQNGTVCTLGALSVATNRTIGSHLGNAKNAQYLGGIDFGKDERAVALANLLGFKYPHEIISWNDADKRSRKDVLARFDGTIASLS